MNELPSAPIPESRPSPLQVWQKALTKPSEQTYAELAASPNARASTGYLWVFLASLVQVFLVALVQNQIMGGYFEQMGFGDDFSFGNRGVGPVLVGAICGAPIGAAISTLFFAVWVSILQWIARMFGGRGTVDQLAYALAAIGAPYTIIVGLLSLLGGIQIVGYCVGGILFFASIYIMVLNVMAIKGVNQISWGAAIGTLLIPALVIAFLCACLVAGLFTLLLPVFRDAAPNFAP